MLGLCLDLHRALPVAPSRRALRAHRQYHFAVLSRREPFASERPGQVRHYPYVPTTPRDCDGSRGRAHQTTGWRRVRSVRRQEPDRLLPREGPTPNPSVPTPHSLDILLDLKHSQEGRVSCVSPRSCPANRFGRIPMRRGSTTSSKTRRTFLPHFTIWESTHDISKPVTFASWSRECAPGSDTGWRSSRFSRLDEAMDNRPYPTTCTLRIREDDYLIPATSARHDRARVVSTVRYPTTTRRHDQGAPARHLPARLRLGEPHRARSSERAFAPPARAGSCLTGQQD